MPLGGGELCRASARFNTAERAPEGIEAMHTIRKGQVKRFDGRHAIGQAKFVESLSGVAA
jgi:hypothetical protein